MPPRKKIRGLAAPEWVLDLADRDPCLYEVVMEAFVARLSATERGAEDHDDACRSALRSADTTMESIRDGRVKGREAWQKAAVAVRKYNTASECASPSAVRHSRKRRRH